MTTDRVPNNFKGSLIIQLAARDRKGFHTHTRGAHMKPQPTPPRVTRLSRAFTRVAAAKDDDGLSVEDLRTHLAISILPDVQLKLSAQWPEGDSAAAGHFEVIGPGGALKALRSLVAASADESDASADESMLRGTLSPASFVTVPAEKREAGGIPLKAHSYCFMHPLSGLHAALSTLKLSRETWALALLAGGFAYFDDAFKLLQVNAITYAPSSTGLMLIRHPVAPTSRGVADAMRRAGRMAPIIEPRLTDAGFEAFGWVHGSELIDGHKLSVDVHSYEHGAFLYQRRRRGGTSSAHLDAAHHDAAAEDIETIPLGDGPARLEAPSACADLSADDGTLCFWSLVPASSASWTKQHAVADPEAELVAIRNRSPSEWTLPEAMVETRRRCEAAMRAAEDAATVCTLDSPPAADVPLHAKLCHISMCVLVLVGYLGLGGLFYFYAEADQEWTFTMSCYFSAVSISTVGYGDLVPSSTMSQLFTIAYIFFGIAVVFNYAGEINEFVLSPLHWLVNAAIRWCMAALARCRCRAASEGDVPSALAFYSEALLPSFLVGFSVNIMLYAYLLTLVQEDLPLGRAVWHCITTATTNGYGDVQLTNDTSRQVAMAQIIWSVSWLAAFISNLLSVRQERAWAVQRARSLRLQLSEQLIGTLETDAARRDGRGVSEVEFVAGMLITLGAEVCGEALEFQRHIKPLMDRFRALDEDRSGYLTRGDLTFMVGQAARQRQNAASHQEGEGASASDAKDES